MLNSKHERFATKLENSLKTAPPLKLKKRQLDYLYDKYQFCVEALLRS